MSKEKLTLKQRLLESIDSFFRRRIVYFWILLSVIALVIIGVFVWSAIDKNIRQESTSLVEAAEEKYSDWLIESDENIKTANEENLLDDLAEIIKNYPRQFAAQKALSLRANLYFEKGEWEKAAKDYKDISQSFPKSYYAPIALFNAGISYEESGDLDSAIDAFAKIVATYKDSYDAPYALYMMGRISEKRGKYKEAEQHYSQLKDQYQNSNWSKLAQNRIIYLQIQEQ